MSDFVLRAGYEGRITWSRGSCGNPGCKDPECCCALCRKPIGVPDDDPRSEAHGEEDCFRDDCPVCVDRVPLILFRGEGKDMVQAAFHTKCFQKAFWMPSKAGPIT